MPRLPSVFWLVLCLGLGGLCAGPAAADETKTAVRTFKKALKADAWKDRAEAYTALSFYDGAGIVGPMLDAISAETHGAVQVRGLALLGKMATEEAQAALLAEAAKGKPARRMLALVALQSQTGAYGAKALMGLLKEKSGPVPGLAALVLGMKQVPEAIEPIAALLERPDWQLRGAAARGLTLMAGEKPVKKYDKHGNVVPEKNPKPWVPKFYDVAKVLPALVEALAKGVGSERLAIIDCLERLTKQTFGWDVPAWRKYAAGTDPKEIKSRPKHPPSLFGVPLFGQRTVVIYDVSNTSDDPHPFSDPARLKELCKVPGGRPIPWYKLKKRSDLIAAHTKRWVSDLPKKAKFDVVFYGAQVQPLFGKLSGAGTGPKKRATTAIAEVKLVNGSDAHGALHTALDLAGAKMAAVWKKGPDEVLFMSTGIPWEAAETDQESIAGSVGLKALMRLTPVHNVGVGAHPWAMMRPLAKQTGGRYVDLQK